MKGILSCFGKIFGVDKVYCTLYFLVGVVPKAC